VSRRVRPRNHRVRASRSTIAIVIVSVFGAVGLTAFGTLIVMLLAMAGAK
jgi:hypothetical protein